MPASPPNPGAHIANKSLQALKHLKAAVTLVWQSSRNWTLAGIVSGQQSQKTSDHVYDLND